MVLLSLFFPAQAIGSEVLLKLSGNVKFPGIMIMQNEGRIIEHLCFLGDDAKGSVDVEILGTFTKKGIPAGHYEVSDAFPEEQWPDKAFSKNGALRLVPTSKTAHEWMESVGKDGLAVHGRDFFPLAANMTKNPKMIRFVSDQLFEKLSLRWGALRISNWDMGRLHDYYRRNTVSPDQWKVKIVAVKLAEIKPACEPLKVQRKPGGPLE